MTRLWIITLLISVACSAAMAQDATDDAPEQLAHAWTLQLGGDGTDRGQDLAIGEDGAIYICGYTATQLTDEDAHGGYDGFISKVSADGDPEWTVQVGTAATDQADKIWLNGDKLFVAGVTGGGLYGQHVSHGGCNCPVVNIWIAQFDLNGTEVWSSQFGLRDDLHLSGLLTDSEGNAYLYGYAETTMPGSESMGGRDMFVLKYDSDGDLEWSKNFGRENTDTASEFLIGEDDTLYLIGQTTSEWETPVANGDDGDLLILAIDTEGEELWARQYGSSRQEWPWDAKLDATTGDIYIVGYSDGDLIGDPRGGSDGFILALDGEGYWLWADAITTPATDFATTVTQKDDGSLIVCGVTDGTLEGPVVGAKDMFIVEYTPDGTRVSELQYGSVSQNSFSLRERLMQENIAFDSADQSLYTLGRTRKSLARENTDNSEDIVLVKLQYPSAMPAIEVPADTPDTQDAQE